MAREGSRVEHPQETVNPDGDYADVEQRGSKYGEKVELMDPAGDLMGDVDNPVYVSIKEKKEGYQIAEVDESSPAYYGFEDSNGNWYIMKEDSNSFRFAKGTSDFSTNWTNRASLSYDYPSNTF